MNYKLILPSSHISLSPIVSESEVENLTVMGLPISSHIKSHLAKFGITPSSASDEKTDACILVESNLITNTDLQSVLDAHLLHRSDITVVLRPLSENSSGNIVSCDESGFITDILNNDEHFAPFLYETEGIYILSESAHTKFKNKFNSTSGTEFLRTALKSKLTVRGYVSDANSISVTNIDSYKQSHIDILNKKLTAALAAKEIKNGFWLENGVKIDYDVSIETPVYISSGCHIERCAKINGNTFIGRDTSIKTNSCISHCVINSNCIISHGASVNGGVIADKVNVGAGSEISENAIIGSNCRIEENCHINAGVKIWPNKRIMQGTRLSDNLVWGSVGTEHFFRKGKIRGEVNIEVTPEFMTKLGAAYGTMYNNHSVGLSYDSSPVCSVLAKALSAGITSAGAELYCFGEQTLPITRSCVRYYKLISAMHINIAGGNGFFYPEIEFIEEDGSSFSSENESTLENIFFSNLFYRADAKSLKEPLFLFDSKLHYTRNILNGMKSKRYRINAEIRTRSESVSEVLEILMKEIEKKAVSNPIKQFSADIADNGQDITLYDSVGNSLDYNKFLGIISVLLVKRFGCDSVVLPISVSEKLEEYLTSLGVRIIYSGISSHEMMKKILRHELIEQSFLFFDGTYLAMTLLDYLNETGEAFDELVASLPDASYTETEIECSNTGKKDIIRQLHEKYKENKLNTTDGIKIYKSNGWVLVIPEKYRHSVKIITEGKDMEAAEEICNVFVNQIKKLAKPE